MRTLALAHIALSCLITLGCEGSIGANRASSSAAGGGSPFPWGAGGALASGAATGFDGLGGSPAGIVTPPQGAPIGPSGPINPGRVVAHRLNRVEYDNTTRDLVGVDLKLSSQAGFPDDNYVEGFDNNAESLTASPLLLEKYQTAAAALAARLL